MYTHLPVRSFDSSYINTEVFTLLHCNHLRCRLKAELLHHGLEVVLTRTLREKKVGSRKYRMDRWTKTQGKASLELPSTTNNVWQSDILLKEVSYQVIKSEDASVLSQKVGAKLTPTQRKKHAGERLTVLRFDLQHRQNTCWFYC